MRQRIGLPVTYSRRLGQFTYSGPWRLLHIIKAMHGSVLPLSVEKLGAADWSPLHVSQMGLPALNDAWSFGWRVAIYQGSYYIISTVTGSTNNHFSSILAQALLLKVGHL